LPPGNHLATVRRGRNHLKLMAQKPIASAKSKLPKGKGMGKGNWGIVKCEECGISGCGGARNHLKLNGAGHFKRQRQQRLPNRWRFKKERQKKTKKRRKTKEPAPKSRAEVNQRPANTRPAHAHEPPPPAAHHPHTPNHHCSAVALI